MSDLITVRTKMQPWKELQVDQAEYDDLKAQGLLEEQTGIAQAVADQAAAQPESPPATSVAAPKRKGTQ